jgi:MFS transporter, PAT family, beta-lactamase induction signal transducer AmpG
MNSEKNWLETMKSFSDIRSITMLLLGFSAGLPILMIFSSLSLWLREAGVERSAVTYFSWAALGYSFKFIWAPLIDRLPLPFLTQVLGRRRSWLLFSQILIIISICWMALVDPAGGAGALSSMALATVMLGFSSATQDIVIDAYRIESAPSKWQAILSAAYIAGYRVGMLASGAGALFIAAYFGTTKDVYNYAAWRDTYLIMASLMSIGIITGLLRPEPELKSTKKHTHSTKDYLTFFALFLIVVSVFVCAFYFLGTPTTYLKTSLSDIISNKVLISFVTGTVRLMLSLVVTVLFSFFIAKLKITNMSMIEESYIGPVKNFFDRYGINFALLLLSLIGLYRISDIVLGVISNVFYQDLGFTKAQIASVVKTLGLIMSLLGGFLGGILTTRFGIYRMLWWGAILAAGTNILFMIQAELGPNISFLYLVISADNLAAGLASAAFVAFLSSLTDISFTAVQYAIFSSLMTLIPKIIGGYSGGMVDILDYSGFFLATTLMGIPVLYIIYLCQKTFNLNQK